MHDPPVSVVIIQRVVLRAAIVPKGDRSRCPLKAAAKFFTLLYRVQAFEYRAAFLGRHTVDREGMRFAAVERFTAGLGVSAHKRV